MIDLDKPVITVLGETPRELHEHNGMLLGYLGDDIIPTRWTLEGLRRSVCGFEYDTDNNIMNVEES